MRDIDEIKQIARERLEEANVLIEHEKYNGAFYLAGYAVELHLKAKICDTLKIGNLFDEDEGTKIRDIRFNEIRKVFKTHNLIHLLWLSGLKQKFDEAKAQNRELHEVNSLLFENWNEQYRYKPCGFCKEEDVVKLLSLISDPSNGLIQWIEKS